MTASIFSSLTSPASLWLWELLEFVSIIIVGVGCWGEVWSEHHKFAERQDDLLPHSRINKVWVRRFWLMVVWGLALELFAFTFSFLASNREISELRLRIEELRTKNDELAQGQLTRLQIFSSVQGKTNFINALKGSPKMNVKILYPSNDGDAFEFGLCLQSDLAAADWNVIDGRPIKDDDVVPISLLFQQFPTLTPDQRGAVENFFGNMPLSEKTAGHGFITFVTRNPVKFSDLTETNNPVGALANAFKKSGGLTPSYIGTVLNSDPRMPQDELKIEIGTGF